MPWIRGETPDWRRFVVSEYDYSAHPVSQTLGLPPKDCRLFMVFDGRYKMMHAEGGLRPMLFDLQKDPEEVRDLAKGDTHEAEIARLYDLLADWGRRCAQRVTMSDTDIIGRRGRSLRRGILPFLYDGTEVPEDLTARYRGPAPRRPDES